MITGLFTQAMSASDFGENIYVADAFARVRLHARRTGARSEQLDLSLGHEMDLYVSSLEDSPPSDWLGPAASNSPIQGTLARRAAPPS
jgi:hypothetical protein